MKEVVKVTEETPVKKAKNWFLMWLHIILERIWHMLQENVTGHNFQH